MRRAALPLGLNAAFVYLVLYAPIAIIVTHSFNSAKRGGAWVSFTTEWYRTLFSSSEKFSAVTNTLILAVVSTGAATLLGTLLGYGLSRYSFPGKKVFSWLLYIPVVIPDIVAAVAMLMFFSLVRDWLHIFELGLVTMIVAHVSFQVPFIAIIVRSRLAGMDPSIEEAAHDLGANAWQKIRHVTLPLMLPGIFAGAALAFTLSLDDFVISFFTSGPGAA
ncbi:MAG TPA: ABC transporter permease, partial [Verrucomicrobiae bacterium]|nr:ABC transporter permease [Verrucomicrobiae bacterium]